MNEQFSSPVILPVVAAALVDQCGAVLVQRRPAGTAHAGLWEFPGGKIESGEAPEVALARELAEELGIEVDPNDAAPVAFASHAHGDRHLLLLLYIVRRWSGTPVPLHADAIRWCTSTGLATLAMPPADRTLVERIAPLLG